MILIDKQKNSDVYDNIFVELTADDAAIFLGDTQFMVSRKIFERLYFTMEVALLEEEFCGRIHP